MKSILSELRTAAVATAALVVLLCGVYPVVVWGIAQLAFSEQANGSLIHDEHGKVIGSSSLAQPFTEPRYFHPRPSAAGNGYDAANSSGSNLGPLSKKHIDAVQERVNAYRSENNLAAGVPIPADAVTTSASGLDPHISVENARLQAPRVAQARSTDLASVRRLIEENTKGRSLGVLGEPGVNVLQLNLALDKMK